ncbi:MAG: hypothetical protein PVG24_05185 [Gammaproteobacteria bacterium]|jgi:hypothetical protein
MFGTTRLAKTVAGMIIGFTGLVAASGAASAAVLPVVDMGTAPGTDGTLLQRIDLGQGATGLTSINTIVLTDISGGSGGDEGVFSGYDLDAFILDRDGDFNTSGDQVTLSGLSLTFTGGTTRPTADPTKLPSAPADVGTYFGTDFNTNSIKPGTTTLGTFDAVNISHIQNSDGFLTLGDGGELVISFADILTAGGLYLFIGEVGGQGEAIQVEVPGQVPLPGAVWLFLSAIAVLFGFSRRRSIASA